MTPLEDSNEAGVAMTWITDPRRYTRRPPCPERAMPLWILLTSCALFAPPLPADRAELWQAITTGSAFGDQPTGELPDAPHYRTWSLMPTFDGFPPFEQKPLALPTHGRFVTVWVNDVARDYLEGYLADVEAGGGDIPMAALPVGSILVKENVPATLPDLGPADAPAVLTVAYKPSDDFCDSGERYDGTACVGGNWMWAFYGLDGDGRTRSSFDTTVGANTTSFCVNCHDPGVRTDYLRGLQNIARHRAGQLAPTRDPAVPPAPGPFADDPFCATLDPAFVAPGDVPLDPLSIDDPVQRQRMFDCFAWRSFVALAWPAADGTRGAPDETAALGDRPQAERVWETYAATWELFQPNDPAWDPQADGLSFDDPRPVPAACADASDTPLPVVAMVSKSSHSRDVANETGQAFAGTFGTLTDRNGELVRYQVLFDRTEFDALLPTAATRALTPAGPDAGAGVRLPDGATEVKASWKVLCDEPGCAPVDDPSAFYVRDVLVYDAHGAGTDSPSCRVESLALVGLHVARKTFWAPQWVWATFEHRSNVPPAGEAGPDAEGYAFFDPACEPQPGRFSFPACAVQPFLAPMGPADPCCANAELNRFPDVGFGDRPNQLTRLAPVGPTELNASFADALSGTVWSNYMLVNTQWPLHGRQDLGDGTWAVNPGLCPDQWDVAADPTATPTPDPTCYTMVPSVLRNTSMESYMTLWTDASTQRSNRSCMGCHFDGTDFSYIWLDAVEQVVPR